MDRPYRHLEIQKRDRVFCVHIPGQRFDEISLGELGTELARLVDEEGCQKMVLKMGPDEPQYLFSLFLAKLVHLQRHLKSLGGTLVLAELSPTSRKIFETCGLGKCFSIYSDQDQALAALRNESAHARG